MEIINLRHLEWFQLARDVPNQRVRMYKSFHAIMLKDVKENAYFVVMDNWLRCAVTQADGWSVWLLLRPVLAANISQHGN